MKANYHTHTFRCHHAQGCEWEYVEKAIEGGLKIFGFADHAPWKFPEGHRSRSRMPYEALPAYIETSYKMKELYGDKIQILCGLEAEYYPDLFPAFLDRLREISGVEYLILGQHYLGNEYDDPVHVIKPHEDARWLAKYVDQITAGMETGRFLYLAHPDMVGFEGDPQVYKEQMRRLCRNANALNMPLEINMQGYRSQKGYPAPCFWEIAAEENCTAIIGADAHCPKAVCNPAELEGIEAFARSYGLKVAEELQIVKEEFLK